MDLPRKLETKLNVVKEVLSNPGLNRRSLLTRAGVVGAAALGAGLLGESTPSAEAAEGVAFGAKGHRFVVNDYDILNFALNLEYLEAEYYQVAANGTTLARIDPTLVTPGAAKGTGNTGALITDTPIVANAFGSTIVQQYAQEIAQDELTHVQFLRAALGKFAVAAPSINISTGVFTAAANAAGITGTFSPYAAGDAPFLLGAFIFEDVGVTAYHGAAPYIKKSAYLSAAAGILAVEAYHAAEVRLQLLQLGAATPSLISDANSISALRNLASEAADGATTTDQGITITVNGVTTANITPTDTNALAFSRTFAEVLNIVYLNATTTPTAGGGFFPNGLNGRITTMLAPAKVAK